MLRAPRQRLISAFNGGAHACIGLGGNNLRRMYAGACNAATYARVPGVADCQARMVTDCSSVSTHSSTVHCRSSASLAAESGRRLHALAAGEHRLEGPGRRAGGVARQRRDLDLDARAVGAAAANPADLHVRRQGRVVGLARALVVASAA